MKNLGLLLIYLTVAMSACHKKTKVPHYLLSATLKANFGYQVGSYWIYKDSISGETDSFYTYKSNFYTENNGGALVDRMDIFIKKYGNSSNNEIWSISLLDSSFNIMFINDQDNIQTQLTFDLFTYPFLIESLRIYGEDSGFIQDILPNFSISGFQFNNTIISYHKNYSYRVPLIIYNDYFYMNLYGGFVKVIFNHPQDSVYRVLELQRYNIIK